MKTKAELIDFERALIARNFIMWIDSQDRKVSPPVARIYNGYLKEMKHLAKDYKEVTYVPDYD